MILTSDNEPNIKKSVIVGISGLQRMVLQTVSAYSRREFKLFDDLDQPKDYLIAD